MQFTRFGELSYTPSTSRRFGAIPPGHLFTNVLPMKRSVYGSASKHHPKFCLVYHRVNWCLSQVQGSSVPSESGAPRTSQTGKIYSGNCTGFHSLGADCRHKKRFEALLQCLPSRRRGEADRVFLAAIPHFVFLIYSSNVAPKSRM